MLHQCTTAHSHSGPGRGHWHGCVPHAVLVLFISNLANNQTGFNIDIIFLPSQIDKLSFSSEH